MHRVVGASCVLLLCCCLFAYGDDSSILVRFEDLVYWPILSASIPVEQVLVSPVPQEALTGWGSWLGSSEDHVFGILPIGSGQNSGISIIIAWDGLPVLAVDKNNDKVLSGDEVLRCESREPIGPRSYSWFFTALVEYEENGTTTTAETHFQFSAAYSHVLGGYRYFFAPFCQKVGEVVVGESSYQIAITTVAANATYDDLSALVVAVDTDGDGYLDTLPASHEVYYSGLQTILIGTQAFRIQSVSADGTEMLLSRTEQIVPRVPIGRLLEAPGFETTTIEGETLSLDAFRGDVVVLLFFPTLVSPDCESCNVFASPVFYNRFQSILDRVLALGGQLHVLVVLEDRPSYATFRQLPQSPNIAYIYDPAINHLYRRSYSAIVIDQFGVIQALDEVWISYSCSIPRGSLDVLDAREIAAIAERLLGTCETP